MIRADENYGLKQLHGLKWGIYKFVNGGNQVRTREFGGDVERLKDQDLSLVTNKDRLIIMGNIWVHPEAMEQTRFRHPDLISKIGCEAYYWDNPQLPHLLYQGEWNPQGYKNWMRLVKGNAATQTTKDSLSYYKKTGPGTGAYRINKQLESLTNGKYTTWQSIVGPRRECKIRSNKALLCPSGAGIFENYYGLNKRQWIQNKTKELTEKGWQVILRDKPTRSARETTTHGRLYQRLITDNIGITVSLHSVAPVESLLVGVPALVEGRHAGGDCATNYDEYLKTGNILLPSQEKVEGWVNCLLEETYHKTEVYKGEWNAI